MDADDMQIFVVFVDFELCLSTHLQISSCYSYRLVICNLAFFLWSYYFE